MSPIAAIAMLLLLGTVAQTHAALAGRDLVSVVFHLARENPDATIEQAFVDRSEPSSPLFRKHLTLPELEALVRASPATRDRVKQQLTRLGAKSVRVFGTNDAILANVPRGSALYAALQLHADPSIAPAGAPKDRTTAIKPRWSVAVPTLLQPFVTTIVALGSKASNPTHNAFMRPDGSAVAQPGASQSPPTIRARYNVPATPPTRPANYTQGVAEFDGEYFLESDMEQFVQAYSMANVTIDVMGPTSNAGSADAIEGTLDLQYMAAMANGTYPTWWLAQNTNNLDPGNIDFSLWCDTVLALPNFPLVVSISWGMGAYRYVFDPAVMTTDNDAFRKLGLMGVSVFGASGDSGPGTRSSIDCTTFQPSWPSSSPKLTSVGATYATSASAKEEAVNWSGGGFSDTFATPSYQKAAVSNYLSTAGAAGKLPGAAYYNATGRGYPDVAALGTNFQVYVNGMWQPISGTSCASPTFAGVVSLINAERIAKGQPSLGFLNPKLYQLGKVGYDVVAGASVDTDCFGIPLPGFPAMPGWDAVSGLGTPDYNFLLANL